MRWDWVQLGSVVGCGVMWDGFLEDVVHWVVVGLGQTPLPGNHEMRDVWIGMHLVWNAVGSGSGDGVQWVGVRWVQVGGVWGMVVGGVGFGGIQVGTVLALLKT